MKKTLLMGLCLTAVLSLGIAHGLTLGQQEAAEKGDKIVADAEMALNHSCGAAIKVKVEWGTFTLDATSSRNPASWCSQAVESLGFACQGSNAFKTAASKMIKTVTCTQGGQGSELFTLSPEGDLNYAIDWDSANIPTKLVDFLKQKL